MKKLYFPLLWLGLNLILAAAAAKRMGAKQEKATRKLQHCPN